jgi:hypothetical protein
MQVRQRLVSSLIDFIKSLDALVPKGADPLPKLEKAQTAMAKAFTELCKAVAIELSYSAALENDKVRVATAGARRPDGIDLLRACFLRHRAGVCVHHSWLTDVRPSDSIIVSMVKSTMLLCRI